MLRWDVKTVTREPDFQDARHAAAEAIEHALAVARWIEQMRVAGYPSVMDSAFAEVKC